MSPLRKIHIDRVPQHEWQAAGRYPRVEFSGASILRPSYGRKS
eukprot:SAG31_NODE_36436_length_313_cov_0.962617_1_plen_42_part_01